MTGTNFDGAGDLSGQKVGRVANGPGRISRCATNTWEIEADEHR